MSNDPNANFSNQEIPEYPENQDNNENNDEYQENLENSDNQENQLMPNISSRINFAGVNNELLKNIESLSNENTQLKTALSEFQEDLKEKESSLEESHKIIKKLQEEYTKIIKEYQLTEQQNKALLQELQGNKTQMEGINKSNEIIQKQNKKIEELQNENMKLKKENFSMKGKINNDNAITSKKENDLKNKEMIISDLKERSENWVLMIKEREALISELNQKIKEQKEDIDRKDEQLKVMVNFSKQINKENKTNVTELTKQAVKTIKVFYNTLNNGERNQIDNANRVEFIGDNTTFQDFENNIKNNRAQFSLKEALNGMMYIPEDLHSVSKEFLMDMNFKTELIKSELYASLIREANIVNYLEEVFAKLNIKDAQSIKSICEKVILIKTLYDNLKKENERLKKTNTLLVQNKNETDLYVKKLKDDVKEYLTKLKDRYFYLASNIDNKVKLVKNNNIIIKEKAKKDEDKLKNEVAMLKNENKRLKGEVEDLKRLLEDEKNNQNLMNMLDKEMNNKRDNIDDNPYKNWNDFLIRTNEESFIIRPNLGTNMKNMTVSNNSYSMPYNNYENMNNRLVNSIPGIPINNMPLSTKRNNISSSNNQNTPNDKYGYNNNMSSSYNKKKKEIIALKDEINKVKDQMNNLINNPNDLSQFTPYNNGTNLYRYENMEQGYNNNLNQNDSINPNSSYNPSRNPLANSGSAVGNLVENTNNILNKSGGNRQNMEQYPQNNYNFEDKLYGNLNERKREIHELLRKYQMEKEQDENRINQIQNEKDAIMNKYKLETEQNVEKLTQYKAIISEKEAQNEELKNQLERMKNYYNNYINDIQSVSKANKINNNQMSLINLNKAQKIFNPAILIKLFFNISNKIFSSSELKKYYQIYDNQSMNSIIDAFQKKCAYIKNKMCEIHSDTDSLNTEAEDMTISQHNQSKVSSNNNTIKNCMDSSYRVVNEKIVKLKKFELDSANLAELIKNYIICLEIIINMVFNSRNSYIEFEPIEKLYKILEDCLVFKMDDLTDNDIFFRKLFIKFFKGQKNCLGLSLEVAAIGNEEANNN